MRVVNGLDTIYRDFSAFAARSENVNAKTPTASVAGGAKHLSKAPFCPQKARILSLCATADLAQISDLSRTERILRYALLRSVCGQSRGADSKRFFGRSPRRRNALPAQSAVKRASFRKNKNAVRAKRADGFVFGQNTGIYPKATSKVIMITNPIMTPHVPRWG